MPKLLIVADDSTGAADCAAASGLDAVVVLDESSGIPAAEAVAIDANTRCLDVRAAAATTARIVQAHPAKVVYKKIDSMLRGHIREETAAALEAYRATGHPDAIAVIAPAFPALERITRGGQQYVRGVAIECAGLPELCDAETDEDLRALVARHAGRDVLWAGSAGLIAALTANLPKRSLAGARADGPVLFVVGSNSERTRGQLEALRESGVAADLILEGESKVLAAKVVERRDSFGALLLTGGDTARAVLDALGVSALRVIGEIETGIPILRSEDARRLLVVTKAGDFGDRESLIRCWRALKNGENSE